MSKTTEFLIPPTMQLTPKHIDAMHLVKLFVKEYENITETNIYKDALREIVLKDFYQSCKNFGF